jgi:hypothetical protein
MPSKSEEMHQLDPVFEDSIRPLVKDSNEYRVAVLYNTSGLYNIQAY